MVALTKPNLYVEKFDGKTYLRVEERKYSIGEADVTISDKSFSNGKTTNAVTLVQPKSYSVSDIDIENFRYGLTISRTDEVNVYDVTFDGVKTSEKHGAVFTTGIKGPIQDTLTIQRVLADGDRQPINHINKGYSYSNIDFLDANGRSVVKGGDGYVFLRDITASNFSDAIIDAKDTVYIMNATLENAHRILRVWPKAHVVIVNSVIELENGSDLIWLNDASSRVSYYNTTWNGKPDPDPDLIKVFSGDKSKIIAQNVKRLDKNPLPEISDFFETGFDKITVEIRKNGGAWQKVNLPNTGENGVAPQGDLLYELPNSGNGNYELRAYFSNDGRAGPSSDHLTYVVRNGSVVLDSVESIKSSGGKVAVIEDRNAVVEEPETDDPTTDDDSPDARIEELLAALSEHADQVQSLGDAVRLVGIDLDGGIARLTAQDGAYGVQGGRYAQQADFDAATGRSESFLLDFNGPVKNVTIQLQRMTMNERDGLPETARYVAFNADGDVVGEGLLTPTGRTLVNPALDVHGFNISVGAPFTALQIIPTAYGDGAGARYLDNNSDFQFKSVAYSRLPNSNANVEARNIVEDAALLDAALQAAEAAATQPRNPGQAIDHFAIAHPPGPGANAYANASITYAETLDLDGSPFDLPTTDLGYF